MGRLRVPVRVTVIAAVAASIVAAIEALAAGADGGQALCGAAVVAMFVSILAGVWVAASFAAWFVFPRKGVDRTLRRARALCAGPLAMAYGFVALSLAEYLGSHFRDPMLMSLVQGVACGGGGVLCIIVGYAASARLASAWARLAAGRVVVALSVADAQLDRATWLGTGIVFGLGLWGTIATFAHGDIEPLEGRLATKAAVWIDASTDVDGDGAGWLITPRDCRAFDRGIHPRAKDVRANGIDEDCNGRDRPSRRAKKRKRS